MKLHLPLPLRSALLAVCSLFAINQTFASTTLTSDIVATEADAGTSTLITRWANSGHVDITYCDRAIYGPVDAFWDAVYWTYQTTFGGTLNGLTDLDGDNRTYSYTLNLHQQCPWVMSELDGETKLTFTDMDQISIIGSCQLVSDGDGGYTQMKGVRLHSDENSGEVSSSRLADGKLVLKITDSNSFTFAEARGADERSSDHHLFELRRRGSLTSWGSVTLDGVDHITFRDNMEGDLIYAGSLSVSNAQSFSYTGNAVHLAHTATSITFSNIENASFTNNTEAIFYEFNEGESKNTFDIHFTDIVNLTFSGNSAETQCLFASAFNGKDRGIYFNDCGTVKITDNRTDEGNLFYDRVVPVFQDCGTVEICNNAASDGPVIGSEIMLSGITGAIRINNNEMSAYGLFRRKEGQGWDFSRGCITADGSEEAWTPLLEMKGNTANSSGNANGLLSDTLSACNIEKIDLSDNHIQAGGTIHRILSAVEISNAGEVLIEDNEGNATGGVGLIGSGHIRQFEKLTVQNNTLSSKQGGIGLFSGSIDLVGRDDMSSVVLIQSNTGETKSASMFGGSTISIKNLEEFCYTDNNYTSSLSRLGCGKVSNVNRFLITNNKTQFDGSIAQSEIQRGGIFSEGFKADSINEFVVSGNVFLTPAKAAGGVFEFNYISYNTFTSMSNIGNFRAENNIIAAKINEDGSVGYAEKAAGAVLSDLSCENGDFLFASNAVYGKLAALGGAVGNLESIAPFSLSGSLTLEDNHAYGGWETESVAKGGALYCRLNIHGGDKLYASGNSAEATCASGGAMYIVASSVENTFAVDEMILQNNCAIGTTSAWGGAAYVQASASPYLPVTPQEIGSLVIRDNYAQASSLENAKGGAIYLEWLDDAGYAFANTDSIYIRGNYITDGSRAQLQSIYSGARISINMQQGQTFECYDGIYSTSNIWVNGGDNYIPQWSEEQYKGTVTFSGKYAQQDLSALNLRFTDEDLQASRTIHAHSVYLTDGTLKLDHVRVETGSHDYTLDVKQANASFKVSSNQAKLEMNNTTIATQAILLAVPEPVVAHGLVLLGNTTFTGSNRIEAVRLWTIGNNTWTFNLNSSNRETAVLSLDFDPQFEDNLLYTPNLNITLQHSASLVKGEYKLLELNGSYGDWQGSLTFTDPDGNPLTLGEEVYIQSTNSPEGTLQTLMYYYGAGPDIPAQRDPAILTWSGIDSVWSAGSGANAGCWTAGIEDLNFYNGDMVTFLGGKVEIEGTVEPGSVVVMGDADTTFSGSGSIASAFSFTKDGNGDLTIRNANSYTGTTYILGGNLIVENKAALGNGSIELGAYKVPGTDETLTGTLQLNTALSTKGGLVFDGGILYIATEPTEGTALTVGSVTFNQDTNAVLTIDRSVYGSGDYVLVDATGGFNFMEGSQIRLCFADDAPTRKNVKLDVTETEILIHVDDKSARLVWTEDTGVWAVGNNSAEWFTEVSDKCFYNGDNVVFQGGEVEIEGSVKPGSVVVEGDADTIFTGEGTIAGATSVVKNGDGTLEIRNTNSYTGGTVLNGGTLVASAGSALGNGAVTLNGGTLVAGTDRALGNGEVTLKGGTLDMGGHAVGNDVVVTGEASINQASAYTGVLRLEGGELSGGALNLAQSAELLSGRIDNALTGSAGVTKIGSGEVALGGSSDYTGATTVQAGTLTVSGSLTRSEVTVAEGARLVLAGGGALGGDITLQQGSSAHLGTLDLAYQELVLEGADLTADCLTLGEWAYLTPTADQSIGGTLKLAGGTLDLEAGKVLSVTTLETEADTLTTIMVDADSISNGNNVLLTYGNAADADWTTLQIQGTEGMRTELSNQTEADGSGRLVLTKTEASLTWSGQSGTWTNTQGDASPWTSGDDGVEDTGFYNGDSVVFQGGQVEIEGSVKPGSVVVEGDADTAFTGEGAIAGATSVVKNGDGTLEIQNTNSYTGGTELNGGTLVASAGSALGNGAVTLNGGTLVAGTDGALGNGVVTLSGGTLDAGGHAVGNDVVVTGVASINQASAYTGVLRLEGGELSGDALNLAQSAELLSGRIDNSLTGSAGVIKSGSGEVELAGNSNYTGETSIQAGKLTVSGRLGESNVTVAEGASLVLGGYGDICGDITLQQGSSAHLGTLELIDQTLTLEGADLTADCLTLGDGATLLSTADQTIEGAMKLAGGTLDLEAGKALCVDTLETEADTVTSLLVDAAGLHDGENVLLTYGNAADADWSTLQILGTEGMRAELSNQTEADGSGTLLLTKTEASLTWAGQSGTWTDAQGDASLWTADNGGVKDTRFYNGDSVSFATGDREIEIQGEVLPRTVSVTGESKTTFRGTGSIAGESGISVSGEGSYLRVENANTYTGGTTVSDGGTLDIANDRALGSGSVTLENAMADFNGHRVDNTVTAKGENMLAGATGLTRMILGEDSTTYMRGEGGYVLGTGQTLVAGLNAQLGVAGRSAQAPVLTLAGGTLVLQGEGFAVNGATSILDSATTVLDLSGISTEGLVAGGSLELCQLGTEVEGDLTNLQVTGLADTLMKRASLSLTDDGALLLTLAKPAKNDELAALLNRNQSRVYDVLCSLAEAGGAEGELAEIADAAAAQEDLSALKTLLDSVSCPELAGMMSSQIEGNLSHLRRLRASMGRGAVPGSGKASAPTAYVQAFNSDTDLEADASGSGYRRNEWGVLFGMEMQPAEGVTIGCAIEESRAKISPTGAARYHEERTTADLYAAYRVGAFSGCTSIGVGMHDYSMPTGQRNGAARDIEGSSFNFSQEFAYAVALGDRMSLQPFFCMDSSVNNIDSYCAGNGGTAALMVDGQRAWATELTLGLRYNAQFGLVSSAPAAFFSAQIGAVCDVGDTTDDLRAHFAGAADKGFHISSADRSRHGFSAGMNLTVPVSESTAVFGNFETVQRGDSDSYHAQIGVRVSF